MTLTFLIGLKQPDRLATDVHEVDVAERVPVSGLDSVHLRTRTRRSACVHPPLLYARCSISGAVELRRTIRDNQGRALSHGRSSQRSWRSFASRRSAPSR